jgi:hypothetical protein
MIWQSRQELKDLVDSYRGRYERMSSRRARLEYSVLLQHIRFSRKVGDERYTFNFTPGNPVSICETNHHPKDDSPFGFVGIARKNLGDTWSLYQALKHSFDDCVSDFPARDKELLYPAFMQWIKKYEGE